MPSSTASTIRVFSDSDCAISEFDTAKKGWTKSIPIAMVVVENQYLVCPQLLQVGDQAFGVVVDEIYSFAPKQGQSDPF